MNDDEARLERRAKEIFETAADLADVEKRAAFIEQHCGTDVVLRQRVVQLMSHQLDDSFLARPAGELLPPTAVVPVTEKPGDTIGRYKLRERVGEGGCGVVYVAEQEAPIRRRVALKVIKLGMDSRSVVARFEAERQALAMMDHPNIAKVLDAGTTDTGRPYFVMELVRGIRITEYCDQAKLSTRERLALFIKVCQAVQHAHQKGIIHRDLKPSNILVTLHDGVPVPKVIDFGIAKATEGRLTDKTVYTELHQFIGTPAYMSPEQAEMSGLDIDTRADIYSLGVLLYEMLTGQTPFSSEQLLRSGFDEMRRIIRDVEPPRPSTRLSTLGAPEATELSRKRQVKVPALASAVQGDLDWIVMKALEKDRTRRYATSLDFAADVQRHLNSEAVIARPPSAAYRFQKMVRRNRTAALATTVVILTLIAALTASTVAFLSERQARVRAASAERAREEARRAAETESIRASDVARFVTKFYKSLLPNLSAKGHKQAVKQLLDDSAPLLGLLTNAPATEAELRYQLGAAYRRYLDDRVTEVRYYQEAADLAEIAGASAQRTTDLVNAQLLGKEMRGAKAAEIAIPLREMGSRALRQTPPDFELAGPAFERLALRHIRQGNDQEVDTLIHEFLGALPGNGSHREDAINLLSQLCRALSNAGKWTQCEDAARQAIEMFSSAQSAELSKEKERVFRFYARAAVMSGNWTQFEETMKSLMNRLPGTDGATRSSVQRAYGEGLMRRGEWARGFVLMHAAATNQASNVGTWANACITADLLNDTNAHRSLCLYGLARFAGGGDDDTSRRVLDGLTFWSRPEDAPRDILGHPVVREIVEHSLQGRQTARAYGFANLAVIEFHLGRYPEAQQAAEEYLQHGRQMNRTGFSVADARFIQAAIEAKLGHTEMARDLYLQSLPKVHPHFQDRTIPYDGEHWDEGAGLEMTRRLAAEALGDAVPATP